MSPDVFFSQFELSVLGTLLAISMIGGMARGFAGFGAGLIIMPVASAVIDPKLAVAAFLIIDFVVVAPLVPASMRKCDWPTITPAVLGTLIFVPLGTYALVSSDPVTVRWGISFAIFLMLALLLSGWRYAGEPKPLTSFGVGGVAGFLSGAAQIPGPPVVTYWMSGPAPTPVVRANLITFFFLEALIAMATYLAGGLFTLKVMILIVLLTPAYALAVWIGANLHDRASEKTFRTIAYILIAISGLTSLPALDGFLRS